MRVSRARLDANASEIRRVFASYQLQVLANILHTLSTSPSSTTSPSLQHATMNHEHGL